ncbi:uncharacterized protein LOC134299692 isoform X2 [Anolis carolinensis]|uniref:uncharacterized protein LOC134299692 isoform X2 n=1 Tax=Anolis carolinensis TaxID=28377 RepID=UPI002F2B663D
MGKGMSRKKKQPGSGPEVIYTSMAEQWQSGNQIRQATEEPKHDPIWSRGGVWPTNWRKVCRGKEEEILQHNGLWRNVDCGGIPDTFELNQNFSGKEETWTDPPFEDPREILIGDSIPPLKPEPAQVETRQEWSHSDDAWLEPRAQGGTQTLSTGTQTEATWTDYGKQPLFHSGRDSVSMLERAKSSEKVVQQRLKEFFALLRILVNIPTLFLLELVHFLGKSVFQVLVVGLLTAIGDQMLVPVLSAIFERILQPLLIFLLNVLRSIQTLSCPFIDISKDLCLQVAGVLRAFRLVEVHQHHHHHGTCPEKGHQDEQRSGNYESP